MKKLHRNLVALFTLFWIILGISCSDSNKNVLSPLSSDPDNSSNAFIILPEDSNIILSDKADGYEISTSSYATTYASSVNLYGPWYRSEWLVVFYLPYNPGNAYFQGRAPWGWQTFWGSYATVWDAKWTSNGFRVRILVGLHVVGLCSSYRGNYRLLY